MEEDEREVELSALCAIFPEINIDAADPFTASLDLPVVPTAPITISFTDEALLAAPDTHDLEYLPPLHVRFSLPIGYPSEVPPKLELSTIPSWLPQETIIHLQKEGERMWNEFGHDQVLFAFIDMLQECSSNAYGISHGLNVSQGDKIALLDFNIKAKKETFDRETFDCGICLDPKKGAVCHRMLDCSHVFCVQCLQDFYNNAITTGDLSTVKCLAPNCAKEREKKISTASQKSQKPKTLISPSELLQIPLNREMVKRYVDLKHKADLETDKNTVYCPRKWCQGGSRSKKHRKPEGLELVEGDSESDTEEDDLMRICEDCSFAFCSRCYQSWHGEYFLCIPRNSNGEITAEDKASLEYIKKYSTSCPTCMVQSQKTHGCNHMICFKCGTHFCYLCSSWLAPDNPYKHYNIEGLPCYMRLWELEEGDGEGAGHNFAGGGEDEEEDDEHAHPAPIILHPGRRGGRQPAAPVNVIARHIREGPLVLRIEQLPAPPAEQQAAALPQLAPAINRHQAADANQMPPQRQQNNLIPGIGRGIRREPVQQREWLDRFVELALNDQEDDLESEEGDGAEWDILPR